MIKKPDLVKAVMEAEAEHFKFRTSVPSVLNPLDILYQSTHATVADIAPPIFDAIRRFEALDGSIEGLVLAVINAQFKELKVQSHHLDTIAKQWFSTVTDINDRLNTEESIYRINTFNIGYHIDMEINRFSKENGEYKARAAIVLYLKVSNAGLSEL